MVPFTPHSACTGDEFPGPKDGGDSQLSPGKEVNTGRSVLQDRSQVPSLGCLDVRQQSGCCSLVQGQSGLAPAAGCCAQKGGFALALAFHSCTDSCSQSNPSTCCSKCFSLPSEPRTGAPPSHPSVKRNRRAQAARLVPFHQVLFNEEGLCVVSNATT